MRYKLALPTAFALLLCASCSVFTSGEEAEIVGSWRWIRSTGGFGGGTLSPDSAGVSPRLLRFGPDHSFEEYRADTLYRSSRYFLEEEDGETIVSYEDDDVLLPRQRVEFEEDGTLMLTDLCYDCYQSTYRRSE